MGRERERIYRLPGSSPFGILHIEQLVLKDMGNSSLKLNKPSSCPAFLYSLPEGGKLESKGCCECFHEDLEAAHLGSSGGESILFPHL